MSSPATELLADSMNTILELPGQSAWSPFRLRKRLGEIQQADARISRLYARFVYFVHVSEDLSEHDLHQLDALLLSGNAVEEFPPDVTVVYTAPRPGTISPWSSKATEIAQACQLGRIRRIERGICYGLQSDSRLTPSEVSEFTSALYDRMTEWQFSDGMEAEKLYGNHEPSSLTIVPLLRNGHSALVNANSELALALSDEEIEYLASNYLALNRDPTDAELMMFAQANSEHCRHKIFNADWVIDGEAVPQKLFGMIRTTTEAQPEGVVSAYSDNAAVIRGWRAPQLTSQVVDREFKFSDQQLQILMKVETHNHPTAISPFSGAATGSGGEIRDEGATGLGAKPKAGLTGFTVSHLRIPKFAQPWESDFPHPDRMATPLSIMLEGPIGGAAFNNEFGRPNLLGYFRSYESNGLAENEIRGYHKPIMVAGGVGSVRDEHARKIDVAAGAAIVVLGGPSMLIGLGGGAASSVASGSSSEDLDFASVQRGNPEMQRRAQEVIDRCCAMGTDNPIQLIHDVGAGGLSNAVPEAVDHSDLGAQVELRRVPTAERGMSPMEIWCNEAQERYVLIVAAEDTETFATICERENCPHALIGYLTDDKQLVVNDEEFDNRAVDMPMNMLLGKPPKMTRNVRRENGSSGQIGLSEIVLEDAVFRVLRFPAVADKTFLIHIGDRTVGGLSVRDQFVGPWQVPVSDVAITASGFDARTGEAMSIGERTPLAAINSTASGRIAVGEAITNITAAAIDDIRDIRLSANWMAAAGHPGEDANLFDTVKAVGPEFCRELGIAIPVGKDSLSMRAGWKDSGEEYQVVSPVSLIATAFAPVPDVRRHLTPQLKSIEEASHLLLLDIGNGANRLGGSCLAQVFNRSGGASPDVDDAARLKGFFTAVQQLNRDEQILAYHDRSDGGLLVTVVEMMFAGHLGVTLQLAGSPDQLLAQLFSEELGAVIQVAASKLDDVKTLMDSLRVHWNDIGTVEAGDRLRICAGGDDVLRLNRVDMQRAWSETSYRMQSLRDNPETAREEYDRILDTDDPGINAQLSFDPAENIAAPFLGGNRPRIAVLREQGVNSQYEMAAAFMRAGFCAVDVHMSDLNAGRESLGDYQGVVACGGFSFGDVLGAGGGWAKSILFQARLRDEFAAFFEHSNTFTLGVCNGCQMLSHLRELIPGADHWPQFLRNKSEQFEARLNLVEVTDSPSIFLTGMRGSRIPIATSHGEGRTDFVDLNAQNSVKVALRYIDNHGSVAAHYPANPNGSVDGICGLSSDDGRATIMMPHPERVAMTSQNSWHPYEWGTEAPWLRMFRNARVAIG